MEKTAVIIGAGPAGIYCAQKFKSTNPDWDVIIYESSSEIGGRSRNIIFDGEMIYPGAAHIMPDDRVLLDLCEEYDVGVEERILDIITPGKINVEKVINFIEINSEYSGSVGELLLNGLGEKAFKTFINEFGYTDMLNASIPDTIKGFGLRDFYSGNIAYTTNFEELWSKMSYGLDIETNSRAVIKKYDGLYHIEVNNKMVYAKKVFVCTGLRAAVQITKSLGNFPVLDMIGVNRFFKLFLKLDRKRRFDPTKLTIHHTEGIFQRVIEESSTMICVYCDNDRIDKVREIKENYDELSEQLSLVLKEKVTVIDTIDFYWENGTHYWKPRKRTTTKEDLSPIPGLYFRGEFVSDRQGWIEGALESIEM